MGAKSLEDQLQCSVSALNTAVLGNKQDGITIGQTPVFICRCLWCVEELDCLLV